MRSMMMIEVCKELPQYCEYTKGPGPLVQDIRRRTLSDGHGTTMQIEIFRPYGSAATAGPAVLWLHGGGFVLGSHQEDALKAALLANATSFTVVTADYRLAPEHVYPAALEDCAMALRWMRSEEAAQFGVDPHQIMVAGESAGGTLALALAAMDADARMSPGALSALEPALREVMQRALKSDDAHALKGVLAVYPPLSMHFHSESFLNHPTTGPLTAEQMRWFWKLYVQGYDANIASHDDECDMESFTMCCAGGHWAACPLLAPDHLLQHQARTVLVLAENDVLYSEGIAYARRLAQAGQAPEVHRYRSTVHGFWANAHMPGGRDAVLRAAHALRRLAGPPSSPVAPADEHGVRMLDL